MGRLPRVALRVAGWASLVLVALVAALHSPPATRAVAMWVEARASQALHARVSILGALSYDLARLRVSARDVRIAPLDPDVPPWFEADEVFLDVPWSALRGRFRLQAIELTRPRLNLERLDTWLDSRPTGGGHLGRLDIDRIAVRDLSLSGYGDSATFSVEIAQFTAAGARAGRTLTAPLQARGGTLRFGPYVTELESIDGTLDYDGQRLSLQPLRVRTSGQHVEVAGAIGLLGEAPAWDLRLALDGDVGPVLAAWPEAPVVGGRARVTGTVTGPLRSPELHLTGNADQLVVAGVEAREVRIGTRISGRGVAVEDASFIALGGRVEGRLTVPSGPTRQDEASVTWQGVDLSALLRAVGSPVRANARTDGAATLAGALGDPRSWTLEAKARLVSADEASASVRGQPQLTMRRGGWSLRMPEGRLGPTDITLDLVGRLPADGEGGIPRSSLGGSASLATGDVAAALVWAREAGLDIPAEAVRLVGGPLSLELTISGTVGSPAVSTRFTQQAIEVRDLGPVVLDGPLRFSGRTRLDSDGLSATLAGGHVRIAGTADASGPLQLEIDVRDVDLVQAGRLFGADDWWPRAGHASVTGRLGGTARVPQASLDVRARDVDWLGQRLDELAGAVRLAGRTLSSDRLAVRAGPGHAAIAGTIDLGRGTFGASLSASAFPLRPVVLRDRPPLDLGGAADITFAGSGPFAAPTGTGHLAIENLRIAGVQPGAAEADLVLEGNGFARVDVKVPALNAYARGRAALSRPWAYEATADLEGLDVPRAIELAGLSARSAADFTGTLAASARAMGRLDRLDGSEVTVTVPRFAGTAYALPIRIDAPAVVHVGASEVSIEGLELLTGSTRVRLQGRLTSDPAAGRLGLLAEGTLSDLAPLTERFLGVKTQATGAFTAEVSALGTRDAPQLSGAVALHDATISLQDRPAIEGVTLVAWLRDGRVELSDAHARVSGGTLEASGSLPLHLLASWLPEAVLSANPSAGPLRIRGSMRQVAAGTVLALAGRAPAGDIDGTFDATVDVSADRLALDGLSGTVRIDRAAAAVREVTASQVGPAEFIVGGGLATFEEWRWQGARTDLAVRGTVGFTATPPTYDIEVRGPIDVSVLGAVIPGRTAGHVRADLRVRQVDGQPAINGELFVSRGAWVDRDLQIGLSDLSGNIRLQTDRVVVEGLAGRLNGGEVNIAGTIGRAQDGSGFSGTISLTGRRLTIEYPTRVVSEFDADVQLVSPGPRQERYGIVGKATVRPGPVRSSIRQLALMFAPGPPVLPTPDVERRRRLMAMVGLDVQLDTAEDIVADSNDLRAQLGGSVHLTGTLASPGMIGKVDIRDDGELFLVGRLYKLTGGQIEFADADRIEPRLNVRGETQVSDYQIELQLTGPVERLDFRLRSNPPLSQGDLASLLTTGQTLKERREAATDAASDAARAQVLSAVSSEYLGSIGRWFGVDTVRIENSARDLSAIDIDPVARLNVTKNLGPSFEVVYSQSIESNDDIYWVIVYDPGWKKLEVATKLTTQEGETAEVRQELLLGGGSRPTHTGQRARRKTPGARVTDVTVTGVPDAEARDVARRLKLSRGDRFDAYKWIRDKAQVERYYRERDRLRATIDAARQPTEDGSGTSLTYAIERGGLTRLRIEGYEFDSDAMLAMRTAWAESPIDEFVAEAVGEAARFALAEDGFVQPRVEVDVRPAGDDAEAVVSVTPGPRAERRQFTFTGNATFASDRLAALLEEADLGPRPWVMPAAVVGPLEAYYGAAGFLNVQITPGAPQVEGGVARLPIAIAEGRQFTVAAMEITGTRQATEAEVRGALGVSVGSVYTGLVSTDGVRRLTELYGRRGHSAAKVTVDTTFDRTAGSASLNVAVDEGPKQVVERVTTEGPDILTRQALIDRSIKVEVGKPVDSAAIETSQRRLYDLGTFMSVEPRFEPVGDAQKAGDGTITQPVKVVFGLEEYPRYRLRYGFQVSTTTLTTQGYASGTAKPGVTADLRRSNVFGTGVDAGIGSFVTADRYRIRGLLSSATLGGRQIQNTLSVTRDYETVSSSTLNLTGRYLTISAEQRWRPRKRLEWAYGYNLEYQDVDISVPVPGGDAFDFLISARLANLFNYASYDTRDNPLNATKGMFHSANVELGTPWLASQLKYASYLGQHFFFVPAGRIRLASAVRFGSVGIVDALEDSLEASLVRFRTGGGTTVRGYRQDELTPGGIGGFYYRGGDVLLVLNQEVRYTTWKWLELAAFVDAGNAFATFSDFSLGDLKLGVGSGMRFVTPFGVIRLDVGFPRPRPDNYPLALWYFSFGQAF